MTTKSTLIPWLFLCLSASTLRAAVQPGTVLWTYDVGDTIQSSPTLARDGTLYVATGNTLLAVTNNGLVASNRWTFPVQIGITVGGSGPGVIAVGFDGIIYLGSQDGNLYAINPDGSQKWAYPAQGSSGSPAIGFDGTIYYVGDIYLHAITASGSRKWTAFVGDSVAYDSPVLGSDGTIYLGCGGCPAFYAFNFDGSVKWQNNLPFVPGNSAALGADGTILFTAVNLFAYSPQGSVLWQTTGINLRESSPVVAKNGDVLVPLGGGLDLYAFDASGHYLWENLTGTGRYEPPSCPAIDSVGNCYYCVSNGVWELNPQGNVVWNLNFPGLTGAGGFLAATSPVIGPNGTVYAALGSILYAIAGTNTLADSSWPMLRQNPRHTGKSERPNLSNPQLRPDGALQFQLFAQVGQTQAIQTSTDLTTWTLLTDLVPTNVPATFIDLTATNAPTRFYRTLSP